MKGILLTESVSFLPTYTFFWQKHTFHRHFGYLPHICITFSDTLSLRCVIVWSEYIDWDTCVYVHQMSYESVTRWSGPLASSWRSWRHERRRVTKSSARRNSSCRSWTRDSSTAANNVMTWRYLYALLMQFYALCMVAMDMYLQYTHFYTVWNHYLYLHF